MKKNTNKGTTEKTLDDISLASWNRSRSMNELRSFLDRREAALEVANIEL